MMRPLCTNIGRPTRDQEELLAHLEVEDQSSQITAQTLQRSPPPTSWDLSGQDVGLFISLMPLAFSFRQKLFPGGWCVCASCSSYKLFYSFFKHSILNIFQSWLSVMTVIDGCEIFTEKFYQFVPALKSSFVEIFRQWQCKYNYMWNILLEKYRGQFKTTFDKPPPVLSSSRALGLSLFFIWENYSNSQIYTFVR